VPVPTAFAREWPRKAGAVCSRGAAPRAASASAPDARFYGCVTIPKFIKRQTFEPRQRLHQPAEFRAVRQHGRKFTDAYFSLCVVANHESHPRLGLSIATRTFGSAVARNRIKRLARESFRLNQHSLPPVDIAVTAREAARTASPPALRESLDRHWKSITQRC
jgi:ribonuclease P protein component